MGNYTLSEVEEDSGCVGEVETMAAVWNIIKGEENPPSKKIKLVSYDVDDSGLSDDKTDPVTMTMDVKIKEYVVSGAQRKDDATEKSHKIEEVYDNKLTPESEPSIYFCRVLQENIENLHQKKVELGHSFNHIIMNNKALRNPYILDKIILHCNIDELGTNFPPEI